MIRRPNFITQIRLRRVEVKIAGLEHRKSFLVELSAKAHDFNIWVIQDIANTLQKLGELYEQRRGLNNDMH